MGEDKTITYETLFNLVRNEKTSSELQKLDDDIFYRLTEYLKVKIETYKNSKNTLSEVEGERLKRQIINARKLIKELYERREKKIIELALNQAKTKKPISIDNLLKEEKPLFNDLVEVFNKYRKSILLNLVNARLPYNKPIQVDDKITVRFIDKVPKFMGPDMKVYGPYDKEVIATLPPDIARLLIKRDKAEEIKLS